MPLSSLLYSDLGLVTGFLDSYWPFIVPGLVSGSIYALLAVGVVLTYQTTGVLNLAFGAQAYVSAVIYYDLRVDAGWPAIPALIVAAFVAAPILGYGMDRLVFRHMRGSPVLIRLAVSIGMLTALPAIAQILTGGGKDRFAPPPILFEPIRFYQWGSLNIDSDQVAVVVTATVVLIVLGLFMKFSDMGLRMRAVVESSRLSELHGVGSVGVNTAAWLISSSLAGLAGVMLAPLFPTLTPINYTLLLMAALAAAVFGRLSSLPLTVLGALLTGIGQNIIIKWFSLSGALATGLRPSFPFIFLFALLLATKSLDLRTRVADPMAGVDPPPTLTGGPSIRRKRSPFQLAVLGVAGLILVYVWLNNAYWSGVFAEAALMAVVFLSLMMLTGQGGFVSLCHAAFVGTGAFVTAQLALERDWPLLLAAVVGALAAGVGGLLLAIPSLRLGELSVALATFGFGILATNLVFNQTWSFGNASGLFPPRPTLGPIDFASNQSFLVLAIVVLLLMILLTRRLLAGTTGRFATAVRGSPTAAASIGINAVPLKIAIFTLSATMAGFAGGLLGSLNTVIAPSGYTVNTSLYWLVVVLVIGVYTIRGAVAAGLVIVLVPEVVSHLPDNMALLQFALFGLGVVSLARHPEGAFEYFANMPARMRERTRLISGDTSEDEHAAALAKAMAEPEVQPDEPGAPVHVLDTTVEERLARRARRRELVIEAIKLRSRIPAYPIKFLYLMTIAFAIDAMSRSLLGIVLEDIRRDLNIEDTDLGVLNAGYAIIAAISVIPFGIIADRWSRVKLIAIGFIPWSLAMIWQGFASTFALMFVARLFLGSIEGTNGPATPSLLGDYYPVKRRNRVFGIFATGTSLGATLGILIGGAMAAAFGWRGSFVAFGIMGGITGAALLLTLREPERGLQDALYKLETEIEQIDRQEELEAEALANPDMADLVLGRVVADPAVGTPEESTNGRREARAARKETKRLDKASKQEVIADDYRDVSAWRTIVILARNRTYVLLLGGQVATDFFFGIIGFFAITFFRRYHSLSVAGASGVVSLLSIALIVGTVQAGRIGDRLVARGTPGARVKFTWVMRLIVFGTLSMAWATPQLALAIPGFLLTGYLLGLTTPLTQAMTIDIVVARLRGQSAGFNAAIRAGATALGPLVLGILSDLYGMRQGTLLLAPTLLLSAFITWLAGRSYDRDYDFAQEESIRQHKLEDADPRHATAAAVAEGEPDDDLVTSGIS